MALTNLIKKEFVYKTGTVKIGNALDKLRFNLTIVIYSFYVLCVNVCWFNEQEFPGREIKKVACLLVFFLSKNKNSFHVSNQKVSLKMHWIMKTIEFHPLIPILN